MTWSTVRCRSFSRPAGYGPPPTRIVCRLDRHSYELYLFHIIVLAGMRDVVSKGTLPFGYKLPYFALFLLLSVLTAGAVSCYVAEPSNAALRRVLGCGRLASRQLRSGPCSG